MQYTGKIKGISLDYETNTARLELTINEKKSLLNEYDELKKIEKLSIEIKKYHQKRGLDANSYYWVLLNQLKVKLIENGLIIGEEELHFKMLKDYSQCMLVPLLPTQNPKGYFKYYEEFKETTIEGKEAIYYKVWKPSSEMDSKEFWVLLKGLESICQENGIETLEEKKLKQLLEEWERNKR
jgi:hypothetical protein